MTSPAAPQTLDRASAQLLAIAQYLAGQCSLEDLAPKLHLNRVDTRQAVTDFLNGALANANVPVEAITNMAHRVAVAHSQVTRLHQELSDLNTELDAERRHLADLARQIGPLYQRLNSLRDTVQIARDHLALLPHADPDLLTRLTATLEAESLFNEYLTPDTRHLTLDT